MALNVELHIGDEYLGEQQTALIYQHLERLERRLGHFTEPIAILTLRRQKAQRLVTVDLRVKLGPKSGELISHRVAAVPAQAVRLAVKDAERQLEHRLAMLRGEPTFGTPSRREPIALRPHAMVRGTTTDGSDEDHALPRLP